MATAQDLVEFYSRLLRDVGIFETEGAKLSIHDGGESGELTPVTISGLRLVLPTEEILRNPKWNETVAFHPLSEDAIAGESPVFKRLKIYMDIRLSSTMIVLMKVLLGVTADKSRHGNLDARAIGLLHSLDSVTSKAVDDLNKLRRVLESVGEKKLMHVRVQRSGKVKDRGYRRATLISYPILTEFERDDDMVFGVKFSSKKSKREIASLFKWILDIDAEPIDRHSKGSDAKVAPGFHSLILAYGSVMSRFAEIFDIFSNELDAYSDFKPALKWLDDAKDLSPFNYKIPALEGNDREALSDGAPKEAVVETTKKIVNSSASGSKSPDRDEVYTTSVTVIKDDELQPLPISKGPGGVTKVPSWSNRDDPAERDERERNRQKLNVTKDEEEDAFRRARENFNWTQRNGNGRRDSRDRDRRDDRYDRDRDRDRYRDRDRDRRDRYDDDDDDYYDRRDSRRRRGSRYDDDDDYYDDRDRGRSRDPRDSRRSNRDVRSGRSL